MTSYQYYIFYQLFLVIVAFFTITKLLFKSNQFNIIIPSVASIKTVLLSVIVVLAIAFFPIGKGGDKERYNAMFMDIFEKGFSKDFGWEYYVRLCKTLFDDPKVFFLITSTFYFIGNYIFFKSLVPKKYLFYFLLTMFGSLGYFAYGTNTIRAGVALSILLLAYVYRKSLFWFIVLASLSVLMHKSMVILLFALIITKYFTKSKAYLFIWLSCLVLTIVNLSFVSNFLQEVFVDIDSRVEEYIGAGSNELYKSGFRYDFLLYSLLPIFTGYYYIFKMKFNNPDYIRFYNIYLIVNSLWLFLIRIPFTDRFAYLSWFLYSFIMLYPLFFIPKLKSRRTKIAMIIVGLILFNMFIII